MGLEKETMRFWSFRMKQLNGYLVQTPVGTQTNQGSSSVHAQWFSHQNGGADIHDVIKWCHDDLLCVKGREL